ncbi:transmembrane protein [Cystoisospora suis]|uniref:Transmembrane protein n=1 Tax=Cystoisospora suis TaxID=483139 RepID=A0A2C6JZR0_9APIC|nr:transmembrane protein [Cystoisospora suis]
MEHRPASSHCYRAGCTRGHEEGYEESGKSRPGLQKTPVSCDYTLLSQRFLCGKKTPVQAFTRSCPASENEGRADSACFSCCPEASTWFSLRSPTESPCSSPSFRGPARPALRGKRALPLSDPSSPHDMSATGPFPFPLSAYLRSSLTREFRTEARPVCALERAAGWTPSAGCRFSCRLGGRLISSSGTGTRRRQSAPPLERRKELPSCGCRQRNAACPQSRGEAGDPVSKESLGGFLPSWTPETKIRHRALSVNFPCARGATPGFSSFPASCRCDCISSLPSHWERSCISVPCPTRHPCQKENIQGCLRPSSKTEQGGLDGKTEKCCKSAAVRRLWRRRPPGSLFCLLQNALSFCVGALLCFVHFFGGEHDSLQLDLSSVLGTATDERTPSPGGLVGTLEGSSLSVYRARRQTRKPPGAGAGGNRLLNYSASDLGVNQSHRVVIRNWDEDDAVRSRRRAGSAEGLQEQRPPARLLFGASGGALSTRSSLRRKLPSAGRKSAGSNAPIVEFRTGAVSSGTRKDLPRSGEVVKLYSGVRPRSQDHATQVPAVPPRSRFTLSAEESQNWHQGLFPSRLHSQKLFHLPFAQLSGLPSLSAISYSHSSLLSLQRILHDETLQGARVVPRRLEAGELTQEPQSVSRVGHGKRGDTAVSAEKDSVALSSGWMPRHDGVPTGFPAWPQAHGQGHPGQGIAGNTTMPGENAGEAFERTTNSQSQVDDVGDGSDFTIGSRTNHLVNRVADRFDSGDQTTSTVIWDAQSQEEPEKSSEESDDIVDEPEKGAEWASPLGDDRRMRGVSREGVDAEPSAPDSHSSLSSAGMPEKGAHSSSSSLPSAFPREREDAMVHTFRRVSERSALRNVIEALQSGERVTGGPGGPWGAQATEATGRTEDNEQGVSDSTDGTGGKRRSWTLLPRVPAKAESGSKTKVSSVAAVDQAGPRTASQVVTQRMWRTRGRLAKLAKMKLRKFQSPMSRSQVCKCLQSEQQQYRLWFTLAVLFGLEWPFYSYAAGGGFYFLRELLAQAKQFGPPPGSTSLVRRRYQEFRECGMPQAFEEGLNALMDYLPSGAELPDALKTASENPSFRKVLFAMGDVHVPFDGRNSLAHVFDMVEDAMGLAWGKDVFLGKDPSASPDFKPFSSDELYYKYMFAFSESRRYFSMLILLSRAMRQHVTQKPHNGIILLLVKQPPGSSSLSAQYHFTGRPSLSGSNQQRRLAQVSPLSSAFPSASNVSLSSSAASPSSGSVEIKTDSLQRLQDFHQLQEQVRQSVIMKLESAIVRFYPTSRTFRRDIAELPDVRVSGFFARSTEGRTHEKGLVGVEIDFKLMEKFKAQTPPNGVLIQVTLLDSWATKPIEEWPDIMDPFKKLVSSYTATQLLKSELMWDQSLASFEWGRTEFVYSTVSEVFEYEKVDTVNRVTFDPDIQVMLLQSYNDFTANGKEDGVLSLMLEVLQRRPLGHSGVPRNFRPDRVVLQGTATPLEQPGGGRGQLYRKGQFGSGIEYGELLEMEKGIREHTVMLHVKIVGLGHSALEDWQSLLAHEILNRLAQRLRGTFEIHYVSPGKPPQVAQASNRATKCNEVVRNWILAVAVLVTASFFIISIILMMYHRWIDVPWWLSCWCSRFSPWDKDEGDKHSTCPSDVEESAPEGSAGVPAHLGSEEVNHVASERTVDRYPRGGRVYGWTEDFHPVGAADISGPHDQVPVKSDSFDNPRNARGGAESSSLPHHLRRSRSIVSRSASSKACPEAVPPLCSGRSLRLGHDDQSVGHPVTPLGHRSSLHVR